MKKLFFAFILLIFCTAVQAQTIANSVFRQGDVIRIKLSDQSDYFYVHEIQKGHSFYALSKIFNVSLKVLYSYNQLNEGATLSIGQKIKIPINNDYLFKGTSLGNVKYGHFIPVYYTTKPKDNLFRISRIYFNQPTEDLIARNKLTSNSLSLGQDILIGWFPIGDPKPSIIEEEYEEAFEEDFDNEDSNSDLFVENNNLVETNIKPELVSINDNKTDIEYPEGFNILLLGNLNYTRSMKEIKKSEVAHWDNTMPDNGTVYVLHKNAIIDSYVEMYNPNMKRSVKAKVIGRIPYGAYTNDVCLVLSPRTAVQLGALDKRFKVEIKALVLNTVAE